MVDMNGKNKIDSPNDLFHNYTIGLIFILWNGS